MPYPQNLETAIAVESIIRDNGAVPATIALINGRIKVGLAKEELAHLAATGASVRKAARRDLPSILGKVRLE
jgi:pseudouridine-5'-phosphate glycosidase/sugar/nucleoside kinase (ribokinase family)